MKYKIVSDSTSNMRTLPGSIEYKTVPLKILADGKEYVDEDFLLRWADDECITYELIN